MRGRKEQGRRRNEGGRKEKQEESEEQKRGKTWLEPRLEKV